MTDISQIVAPLVLQADEQAEWPPVRLRVRTYLTNTLPLLDLVSSVRALVRRDDEILVVRDPVSVHILPGGRREPAHFQAVEILRGEPDSPLPNHEHDPAAASNREARLRDEGWVTP